MMNEDGDPTPRLRPAQTLDVTRGALRFSVESGWAPIAEVSLANGRRADIAAVDKTGDIVIIEVKSCAADFTADQKWRDYLEFCDRFFFAVPLDFPLDLLPAGEGLIIADRFGGSERREPTRRRMASARRKSMLIRLARQAAMRAAPEAGLMAQTA